MIAILSPAKALDMEPQTLTDKYSIPRMLDKSEYLNKKLRKLSSRQIKSLMDVSPAIADLNYERFQSWHLPFDENNAKQACLAFNGAAYLGWEAKTLNQKELDYCQDNVRILSGLYGLLKPLDLIQAYRLEMGCKFKVTPKIKNLYLFWKEEITKQLNADMAENDGVLVNVASNEYFKSIDQKALKGEIINCQFKEFKNGEYKAIMTFAKKARGMMVRYMAQNKISEKNDLKGFDLEGYGFSANLSDENNFVFVR